MGKYVKISIVILVFAIAALLLMLIGDLGGFLLGVYALIVNYRFSCFGDKGKNIDIVRIDCDTIGDDDILFQYERTGFYVKYLSSGTLWRHGFRHVGGRLADYFENYIADNEN